MRFGIFGVAAFALYAATTGLTGAEEVGSWSDPSGRYSLQFASLGWETSDNGTEAHYLRIESTRARDRGKFLICLARVLGPLPSTEHLGQEQANVGSERFGIQNAERVVLGGENIRVEHVAIDGVAVVDLRYITPSDGGLYHHWRTFFLATPTGVVQHQINCGAALPTSSRDEADLAEVLNTLRFTR